MDPSNDDVKKDGPPPPDLKTGPPAPPVPSMIAAKAEGESGEAPPKSAGLKVKIKEDDGGPEVPGDEEADPRAGLGERVGAFLIDLLVCMGISIVLSSIIPFDFLDNVATLAAIAYLLTRDSLPFLHGQSLGKKALGIRVETLDGKGLADNWTAGVLRNVALVVPPFWVVELIVLLSREDKPQSGTRLGDEWAKTRVMKVAAPRSDAAER